MHSLRVLTAAAAGAFGDWEAAYGMYRAALAASPQHVPALLRLAALLLRESNALDEVPPPPLPPLPKPPPPLARPSPPLAPSSRAPLLASPVCRSVCEAARGRTPARSGRGRSRGVPADAVLALVVDSKELTN